MSLGYIVFLAMWSVFNKIGRVYCFFAYIIYFWRTKPWTIYPEHSVPLDWREAEQIFDQVDGGRQVGRKAGQAGGREGAHTLNCSTTYPATKPLPGLGGRLGHGSHRYESRSRFALENSPKLQSSVVLILIPKETWICSIDFQQFCFTLNKKGRGSGKFYNAQFMFLWIERKNFNSWFLIFNNWHSSSPKGVQAGMFVQRVKL